MSRNLDLRVRNINISHYCESFFSIDLQEALESRDFSGVSWELDKPYSNNSIIKALELMEKS